MGVNLDIGDDTMYHRKIPVYLSVIRALDMKDTTSFFIIMQVKNNFNLKEGDATYLEVHLNQAPFPQQHL